MNQTNDEKIDLSKSLPETPAPRTLRIEELKDLPEVDNQRRKMARLIHFRIFTLFLIALLALGVYSQSIAKRNVVSVPTQESTETENFRELLNSLDPSILHEILHEHLKEKYQHGVYQEDKKAMEVVHQQNAEVAITLIELAKRQAPGNGTVTLSAGPPTTTTVSITGTPPTSSVIVISTSSVAVPTSAPPSSSAVQPSQPSQTQAPPTSVQQPTSATRPSSTEVPSQPGSTTQATGTSSERPSQSSITNVGTTSTSQATSSALTPSSLPTTSNSREPPSTSAPSPTTATVPQSSITQQVVFKTTLANGSQSFVTSVTVVPAQQPEQTGAASKTESGSASLQTNAAQKNGYEMRAALLGAVGMAVAAVI
ncbi:hypothetical protein HYFRA_00014012 [Hymenoscyphus fraxineus]|uniref:Uncharacterized protein n=1 Tax=Hymenoscyphus fraxineus TaxID=746836 RepID=A0A9N9PVW9_9HELO|nr:hypothetical protein HYFRA_00014012 [Hymenoscyphus fraxineus]